MLRGLLISGTVGALFLVGTAATGLVDLRGDLGAIRNPFDKVSVALSPSVEQARAWHALSEKADSICARYPQDELVIRPTLPRQRADYVHTVGITLERERAIQGELTALQPPPNYRVLYSQFLGSRQAALAELERLQRVATAKKREDYVLAAQAFAQSKNVVGHYAASTRMPACAF